MRFWNLFVIVWVAATGLFAQDQPPAATLPAAETPAAVMLTNSGKPMVVPFQCTREDILAAGFTCSEEAPCPVYLELSAAAGSGNRYLVAGNIHSDAVTLYSVLLGSDDAGATWKEVFKRIRGAGLDHLQAFDADTGWAGGQQLFPLPEDPFVLQTTDGGKSWRQQAIFGDDAENRFGSIQEMFFTSKSDGSVVIDRSQGGDAGPFSLYDSKDGGASWNVKESSSKPIHLKGAPPPEADWRVRVDANTKSFLLERRQGERWVSRAAFAVNLGACRATPE